MFSAPFNVFLCFLIVQKIVTNNCKGNEANKLTFVIEKPAINFAQSRRKRLQSFYSMVAY